MEVLGAGIEDEEFGELTSAETPASDVKNKVVLCDNLPSTETLLRRSDEVLYD